MSRNRGKRRHAQPAPHAKDLVLAADCRRVAVAFAVLALVLRPAGVSRHDQFMDEAVSRSCAFAHGGALDGCRLQRSAYGQTLVRWQTRFRAEREGFRGPGFPAYGRDGWIISMAALWPRWSIGITNTSSTFSSGRPRTRIPHRKRIPIVTAITSSPGKSAGLIIIWFRIWTKTGWGSWRMISESDNQENKRCSSTNYLTERHKS